MLCIWSPLQMSCFHGNHLGKRLACLLTKTHLIAHHSWQYHHKSQEWHLLHLHHTSHVTMATVSDSGECVLGSLHPLSRSLEQVWSGNWPKNQQCKKILQWRFKQIVVTRLAKWVMMVWRFSAFMSMWEVISTVEPRYKEVGYNKTLL